MSGASSAKRVCSASARDRLHPDVLLSAVRCGKRNCRVSIEFANCEPLAGLPVSARFVDDVTSVFVECSIVLRPQIRLLSSAAVNGKPLHLEVFVLDPSLRPVSAEIVDRKQGASKPLHLTGAI